MTALLMIALWFEQPAQPDPVCFASDVAKLCCPSACAVKKSPKWTQADGALRGCMKSIGCSDGESKSATVGTKCNCSSR